VPPTREQCVASCQAKLGVNDAFLSEALVAMRDCYLNLACGQGDDSCTTAALTAVNADPNDAGYTACLGRHDACSNSGTGFSDDHCVTRFLFKPTAVRAFDACLAGPCDQISACFDNVIGSSS
jgi:hypothetical protein